MIRTAIILALSLFISFSSHGKSCDSIRTISLSELQASMVNWRITTNWVELSTCKKLNRYVVTNNVDCAPCQLRVNVEVDTTDTRLFMEVEGPDYLILSLEDSIQQPETQVARHHYFALEFDGLDTGQLNLDIWMPPGTRFIIVSYGADYKEYRYRMSRKEAYTGQSIMFYTFVGALGLLVLINVIWYIFNPRKDILMYTIYAFLMLIFFSATHFSQHEIYDTTLNQYLIYCIQPLSYVAYTLFIKYFLDTPKEYIFLDRYLNWVAGFFLFSTVFIGILFATIDQPFTGYYFHFYRIMAGVFGIFTLIYLLFRPNQFSKFIVFGGFPVLIGSLICMWFSIEAVQIGPILPIHFMMAGTAIELCVFAAGIGYRIKLNRLEKLDVQKALIQEMRKNDELRASKEQMLHAEIDEARKMIQLEEKEKLSAEFNLKEIEIELQSLRTQMNPHFIFNSLNSIKSFIAKNEPRVAADYLSKFARLMRLILANSKSQTVTLESELEAIEIYIHLERMRFKNKFNFELSIDPGVDMKQTKIQPMIIQPFVENAIWHGLMHKEEEGHLSILISGHEDYLEVIIDDDGVGREKSLEISNQRMIKKHSYGMEITEERLQHFYGKAYQLKIEDKFENGQSTGTRVVIHLPILTPTYEHQGGHYRR